VVEPILCLVCFFFLIWILLLKSELDHTKKEVERLKVILKKKLGHLENEVKVDQARALKGREAEGSMLRFP